MMTVDAGSITVTRNSVLLLTRVKMSSKTLVKKRMAQLQLRLRENTSA